MTLPNNRVTDIAPLLGQQLIDNGDQGFAVVGEGWWSNLEPYIFTAGDLVLF